VTVVSYAFFIVQKKKKKKRKEKENQYKIRKIKIVSVPVSYNNELVRMILALAYILYYLSVVWLQLQINE